MTTEKLEQELTTVKQALQQLQIAVDRMSAALATQPAMAKPIKWLALVGVGKEIWKDIDVDAYIDTERNSWN